METKSLIPSPNNDGGKQKKGAASLLVKVSTTVLLLGLVFYGGEYWGSHHRALGVGSTDGDLIPIGGNCYDACTICVGLFTSGTQLPPDEQDEFCQEAVLQVLNKLFKNSNIYLIIASLPLNQYCNELLQCSSTPTMCCQSQGLCLATDGATGPADGDGIPPGGHCSTTDDCVIPLGLEHGVCHQNPQYNNRGSFICQDGQPGAICDPKSDDCVVQTDLNPPHAVCRHTSDGSDRCQSGQPGSLCGVTEDCVVPPGLDHAVCRHNKCQQGKKGNFCGSDSDCLSGNCKGGTNAAKCT